MGEKEGLMINIKFKTKVEKELHRSRIKILAARLGILIPEAFTMALDALENKLKKSK